MSWGRHDRCSRLRTRIGKLQLGYMCAPGWHAQGIRRQSSLTRWVPQAHRIGVVRIQCRHRLRVPRLARRPAEQADCHTRLAARSAASRARA